MPCAAAAARRGLCPRRRGGRPGQDQSARRGSRAGVDLIVAQAPKQAAIPVKPRRWCWSPRWWTSTSPAPLGPVRLRTSLQLCATVGYGICRNPRSVGGSSRGSLSTWRFARGLRFRTSLMKVGVDGLLGVARDKATAYSYTLTGRKTAPATDFDPFSAHAMHDPYPGYRALLTGPNVPNVWYNRKRGIWIIAGYDDVRKALRDHEALSSAESQSRFRVHLPSMNAVDPPEHTRLRRFVSRAFTPRAMTAWQAAINEVADELVDGMIASGRTEAVSELAKPLPNRLIAMMLGIPRQDHPQFLAWSDEMVAGSFVPLTRHGMTLSARTAKATAAMRRNLDSLIAAAAPPSR